MNNFGNPSKLLVSVDEAARLCGVSRAHLYTRLMRGELPSIRIGRSRRVVLSELQAWITRLGEETTGDDGTNAQQAMWR